MTVCLSAEAVKRHTSTPPPLGCITAANSEPSAPRFVTGVEFLYYSSVVSCGSPKCMSPLSPLIGGQMPASSAPEPSPMPGASPGSRR